MTMTGIPSTEFDYLARRTVFLATSEHKLRLTL
jgi:hypothetical protein